MKELKVGDKFIINRLGYKEQKNVKECESLSECMGYIIVTTTKVNQKSFRTDYSDELLKEIPRNFYIFSETKLRKFSLDRIIKEIERDEYFYKDRVEKAKEFLTAEDKIYISKKLEKTAYERAKRMYFRSIEVFNRYLTQKKDCWHKTEDFIQDNTELRKWED